MRPSHPSAPVAALVAALGLLASGSLPITRAADPAATTGPSSPPAPKPSPTHTVARGALTNRVQLEAVLESGRMAPLRLDPKAWTELTVLEAIPHGTRVRMGDLLVRLDTTRLQEQIDELEADRPAAEVAIELATAELENLRQTTPSKLETARRSRRVADEDAAYFVATGRERREKSARFNLKNAEWRLANAREELQQLQKMYDADDLTEETEEIILKRQKFEVEGAELALESTRLATERELGTMIPRELENLQAAKRDQELALALAEETTPDLLARKTAEVEKLRRERRKADRRLADLRQDLQSSVIRAPFDGFAYHGACENGRWTTGAGVGKRLVPGGKLQPNEILLTVVAETPLHLRAVVPETDLSRLPAGTAGQVSPTADPRRKLPVHLRELGTVPLPAGGFDARVAFDDPTAPATARLTPGMTGKLTFENVRPNALLVPKEAVFGEGDQRFVHLSPTEGTPRRQPVRLGDTDGTSIEILDGLDEGARILLTKPD
jgi:HlyD family secretion protein